MAKDKNKENMMSDIDLKEAYEQLSDSSEVTSPEEAQAKICMILAKTENPEILSDLNDMEVKILAGLMTVGDMTNNQILNKFIKNFLLLRISLDRKGREEIIRVGTTQKSMEEKLKNSLKQQLFSLGR